MNLLGGSTTGEEIEVEEAGELLSKTKSNGTAAAASKKKEDETEEEAPPVGGGWGGSANAKDAEGGSGDTAGRDKGKPPREIISFLKPNLTVAMIDDFQAYQRGKIPEQVGRFCSRVEERKGEGKGLCRVRHFRPFFPFLRSRHSSSFSFYLWLSFSLSLSLRMELHRW